MKCENWHSDPPGGLNEGKIVFSQTSNFLRIIRVDVDYTLCFGLIKFLAKSVLQFILHTRNISKLLHIRNLP